MMSDNRTHSEFWESILDNSFEEKKEEKIRTQSNPKSKKYKLGSKFQGIYLSQREAECIAYLLRGKSNYGVAQELGLSAKTTESYIANIREKLRCRNRDELMAKILESDFPKFEDKIRMAVMARKLGGM